VAGSFIEFGYLAPARSNIANIRVDTKEKTKLFLSFEHAGFIFAPV